MHDALCTKADQIFEEQKDMVHTKVRYESDDDDDEGEDEDKATTVAEVEQAEGSTKRERDASEPSGPGASKKSKIMTNQLPTDDFLNGSSASVRYVDDWAGNLNDVDGYSSGADDDGAAGTGGADGVDVFDDSYFEARRQEGALSDNDGDDEDESSENDELESLHDNDESLQHKDDFETRRSSEEGGEDEDEDAFMEVVSPNISVSSQAADPVAVKAVAPMEETFEEEDDEEDMEEVV